MFVLMKWKGSRVQSLESRIVHGFESFYDIGNGMNCCKVGNVGLVSLMDSEIMNEHDHPHTINRVDAGYLDSISTFTFSIVQAYLSVHPVQHDQPKHPSSP